MTNEKKKKLLQILLPVAVLALVLIACIVLPKLFSSEDSGESSGDPTVAVLTGTDDPTPEPSVTDPDTPKDTPTETPTPEPTDEPTPTAEPTKAPTQKVTPTAKPTPSPTPAPAIDENGWYYSKDEVALYIHTYGKLPSNYITKKEAEKLGWTGGSVQKYKKGAAIGGTYFGNYEGLLPKKNGREYYECDIDTNGKSSRGAKRIIYSNDGLIYYTDDHYESFTLLYGEE